MSVKSKHSISKKDRNGKKEKKRKAADSEEDFESSEEELDLTKECHPIGHYIHDRAEMINQMFSVIKGNKLKAMLPPILKDCDLEQLKLQCLDQLLGMSEKRIACILEGETLDTSSESEVAESDYDSDEKNGTTSGSSSERSDNSHENNYNKDVTKKHRKRKGDVINDEKSRKAAKSDQENSAPEQGKTLLEILELEMRARAIRALLKQSGNEKGNEEPKVDEQIKNGSNVLSGEVVDLTECEDEEFQGQSKKENNEDISLDQKFEEKIERSKKEKMNSPQEGEKLKRMQAELELRNKLFKKKMYRTRQQRMENEEEEKNPEKNEVENETLKYNENIEKIVIKEEPPEPDEIVVEDPEEGEISTSEDEYPVEIKQEIIDPEPIQEPFELQEPVDFELKMDEDAERITAIDNGTFVSDKNLEKPKSIEKDSISQPNEKEPNETIESEEAQTKEEEIPGAEEIQSNEKCECESTIEETSWRDRWLQKDGVQKLVKSSKIYAKVKKRIAEKSQKTKEDVSVVTENADSKSISKIEVIEGSIAEYERLLGKPQKENENEEESQPLQATCES